MNSLRHAFLNLVSLGLLLGMWWWLTHEGSGAGAVSPGAVAARMGTLLTQGYMGVSFADSLLDSASRVAAGWLLSGLIGVALGLMIGLNPYARAALEPWINYGRCVPPLGYLSIVVLWFGVGAMSKMVLLMLSGIPPVAIGTAAAVATVRPQRIEAAASMGFGWLGRLRHVILPSALPGILVSLRIAFGAVFAALIGAEMIASSSGIAWFTITAVNRGDMAVVICCILVMGVIALVTDACLQRLGQWLAPWVGRG